MSREVVVVSGVRTAIGTFGGSLKDIAPTELATTVVREALARAQVEGKDVGHVVFGHVVNTEPKDMYLSRVAAIQGGCAEATPAMNVNRLCGSGLQAIVSASQSILLGDCDLAIGGGAENMSRAPFASLSARWGARMGDTKMIDMMMGALHDPFHGIHMGVTAENVAAKYGITREMQDALALASHNRAEKATQAGYFKDQIVPVMLKSKKGEVAYTTDEHFRSGATAEDFAKLKPVFLKENGTVTAGNSSGVTDGAAALVVTSLQAAQRLGIPVEARLIDWAVVGVPPEIMGSGPVPAIAKLLAQRQLKVSDIDYFEINEAFAVVNLHAERELGIPRQRTNLYGGGISLGHPPGATGLRMTITAMHHLRDSGGRYAVISMCLGSGMGMATLIENVMR